MITHLDRLACTLVRAGHAMVFDYPWELFLTAVEELSATLDKGK